MKKLMLISCLSSFALLSGCSLTGHNHYDTPQKLDH